MKKCTKCHLDKDEFEDFYPYSKGNCISCWQDTNKKWAKETKGKKLKKEIRLEEYNLGFRTCNRCNITKKLEKFQKTKSRTILDSYTYYCKTCLCFTQKDTKLRKAYGIDLNTFNTIILQQENCCAICKYPFLFKKKEICVDHCHKTGFVRGILCSNCNRALGLLKDNTIVLYSAIRYLKKLVNNK